MTYRDILKKVDHTLLKQPSTWEQIREICDDAVKYGTASVCIPPSFVKQAAEYLDGKMPVCTVIGFPNGYNTTAVKVFETKEALKDGAEEIDMVINIGWVRMGQYDKVLAEINALKEACGDHILKVIIETCLLTDEEKIKMCETRICLWSGLYQDIHWIFCRRGDKAGCGAYEGPYGCRKEDQGSRRNRRFQRREGVRPPRR